MSKTELRVLGFNCRDNRLLPTWPLASLSLTFPLSKMRIPISPCSWSLCLCVRVKNIYIQFLNCVLNCNTCDIWEYGWKFRYFKKYRVCCFYLPSIHLFPLGTSSRRPRPHFHTWPHPGRPEGPTLEGWLFVARFPLQLQGRTETWLPWDLILALPPICRDAHISKLRSPFFFLFLFGTQLQLLSFAGNWSDSALTFSKGLISLTHPQSPKFAAGFGGLRRTGRAAALPPITLLADLTRLLFFILHGLLRTWPCSSFHCVPSLKLPRKRETGVVEAEIRRNQELLWCAKHSVREGRLWIW